MKGIKVLALTAISLAAISSSTSSLAAISIPYGWYGEGNLGTSRSQNVNYGTGTSVNSAGFGWNADVGYKFMPYFALEVGYTSYAQSTVKLPSGATGLNVSHHSYDLAGKGILPIADSGVEFFAKVGVARASAHSSITSAGASSGMSLQTGSSSSTGLYIGAGGGYSFLQNIAVNVEWNRARGNSTIGNLDLWSVGITWMFG